MAQNLYGIVLVNKPSSMTSHDVVDRVRQLLGTRKVGHAGTLDPLACGLLIMLVGYATKLFPRFVGLDKEYLGILKLGEVTSTGDSQGEVVETHDITGICQAKIEEAFSKFVGETLQVPPMVSALRVKGKRLYSLARKGVTVEREPRKITIYSLKILSINLPYVEFIVHCSKGTYVRKLAEDIGEVLGCGAHMTKINRLKIGQFKLEDAVELDSIQPSHVRNVSI